MKYFVICALLIASVGLASAQQAEENPDLTKWVASSLTEIDTIRPGMTRSDLLKVFTIEGGLSTGLQRTYVYRKCPYIKVDVQFKAVGRADRTSDGRVTLKEDGRDLIKAISRPYLDWSIMD